MKNSVATKEEMAFLFPKLTVFETHIKAKRPRILNRCMLIVLIFTVRAFVINYFPQYHLYTIFDGRLVGTEATDTLTLARLTLSLFCSAIYLYSFYKNAYFRSANVAVLMVFCSLIWSDFGSLLLLDSLRNLTYSSLAMIAIRLMVGVLLLLNYLDVGDE
jgi:hypothetical protein|tara:strand:- start:915 stop:1394 length:480 start_codon:yes stop_codon:yes gene_type:complete